MAEGLDTVRLEMQKTQIAIANNQLSVLKEFKNNINTKLNVGINALKSNKMFDFKDLQTKISTVFTTGAKMFTAPIREFTTSLSTSFSKIKNVFSALNPFAWISNLKNSFAEKKEKIKSFVGKDINSIKRKFFENWYDPKRLASVFNTKTKTTKTGLFGRTNKDIQTDFYQVWNKPAKVANIWAKEFAKQNKQTDTKKLKSPTASLEQVYGSLVKSVNKIANAVTFFFSGPGFGIALATGLVPPILLLSAAFTMGVYLITQTIEKMGTPIVNILTELGGKIGKILDRFISLIDRPISAITSGVSKAIGSVKSLIKDDGKVQEGQELNTMLFRIHQEWSREYFNPIKLNLENLANRKPMVESFEPILGKISSIYSSLETNYLKPFTTNFKTFTDKALSFFEQKNYDDNRLISGKTFDKLTELSTSFLNKSYNTIRNVYKDLKSNIKDIWQNNNKQQAVANSQINTPNAFSELVSSFNAMRADTNKLLSSINTAILEISKNKLVINTLNKPGTATATDTKQLQQPLQIMVNNSNSTEIVSIMKEINASIKNIVTNTAITDKGETKRGASVWTLES